MPGDAVRLGRGRVRRPVQRASCWRARPSRPASPSCPCRSARRPSAQSARIAGHRWAKAGAAATRSAATASVPPGAGRQESPRRSWSAGTACRSRPAHAARRRRRGPRGRPAADRPRARSARPRAAVSAISSCQAGWNSHLVAPVAEAVVGMQHRRVPVGERAELQRLGAPELLAERRQALGLAQPAPSRSSASSRARGRWRED